MDTHTIQPSRQHDLTMPKAIINLKINNGIISFAHSRLRYSTIQAIVLHGKSGHTSCQRLAYDLPELI
jgi:hypothetical protein